MQETMLNSDLCVSWNISAAILEHMLYAAGVEIKVGNRFYRNDHANI